MLVADYRARILSSECVTLVIEVKQRVILFMKEAKLIPGPNVGADIRR